MCKKKIVVGITSARYSLSVFVVAVATQTTIGLRNNK